MSPLLTTSIFFVLCVFVKGDFDEPYDVTYNDRIGPFEDEGEPISGQSGYDYDSEGDNGDPFFKFEEDYPVPQSFSEDVDPDVSPPSEDGDLDMTPEDYPEDDDEEYEDVDDDYPFYPKSKRSSSLRNRGYGDYDSWRGRSRYDDDDYWRGRSRYDDDSSMYRPWRRRYRYDDDSYSRRPYRRRGYDDDYDRYRSRDRYRDRGSRRNRGRYNDDDDYSSGSRRSRYGRRGMGRSYGASRPAPVTQPKNSRKSRPRDNVKLLEVADKLRQFLGRLSTKGAARAVPSQDVNAM